MTHRNIFKFIHLKIFVIIAITSITSIPIINAQVRTHRWGLVATPDSLASRIAENILRQGGNAIDAGIAAMFALTVVQPYSSSVGGGGIMIVRMNDKTEVKVIDFREKAPLNADPAVFYQDRETFNFRSSIGYSSICVPGFVAGAARALELFGSMDFDQVLQPVIQLAKQGFPVSESLSKLMIKHFDHLDADRATSAIFFPEWVPLKQGEIMTREDLAFTYQLLSLQGQQNFYKGEIAEKIVDCLQNKNGLIRLPDLMTYEASVRPVISGTYRDVEVISASPPSSGGTALVELLKVLENYDLKSMKLNSGPYIHLFVEALKLVFKDRADHVLGDPDFTDLKYEPLISEQHIKELSSQIDSTSILAEDIIVPQNESRNAAHISIIDNQGNAVAISQTINDFFGSAISVADYGILFNNSMNNFSRDSSATNALKPGKRPQTSLAPTVILRNHQPYLVLGSNGAERTISSLAQVIVNVIDFNLPLSQAIKAPRFHYNYNTDTIEMELRIEVEAIEYLKNLGYKVKLLNAYDIYFGNVQAVLKDNVNDINQIMNDVRQEEVVYIE